LLSNEAICSQLLNNPSMRRDLGLDDAPRSRIAGAPARTAFMAAALAATTITIVVHC
jgi:hypothetical protein